jgi:hypothetical protein
MRSLVAARKSNAGLIRLASSVSESNPLFRVLTAWAKMAQAQEDQFLRLSYIEGAMGYEPNTLTRKPALHLGEARKAITSGDYETNPIARKLVTDLQMSPAEALKFVSANDQQIWNGLLYAASNQMRPSGSIRGISAHAVVNSLAFGISPVTGNWMKYGQGKGMMYWLGQKATPGITLEGVKSVAKKEVANRTKDLVRGTSKEEIGAVSLDQPAFGSEVGLVDSPAAILEMLTQDESVFSEDLASAVLRYDATLDIISEQVLSRLRTPNQKMVWEIVRDNPSILTMTPSSPSDGGGLKIGVQGRELAKLVASRTGQEYTGKSMDVVMSKVFRDAVLPAMFSAIKSDEAVKELVKSRDILQVMRQEISRRPKTYGGGGFESPTQSQPKTWKEIPKDDPRWRAVQQEENARLERSMKKVPSWARFASENRAVLVRLASSLPKGSKERSTILGMLKG